MEGGCRRLKPGRRQMHENGRGQIEAGPDPISSGRVEGPAATAGDPRMSFTLDTMPDDLRAGLLALADGEATP
jgi:hypothetical protein